MTTSVREGQEGAPNAKLVIVKKKQAFPVSFSTHRTPLKMEDLRQYYHFTGLFRFLAYVRCQWTVKFMRPVVQKAKS